MRSNTARRRSRAKRERISIYQRQYTKDAYGQKTEVGQTPTLILDNAPAWFEFTGGMETFRGRKIEATVAGVFELRTPSVDLTTDMYIVHENAGGKEYEISHIRPAEAMHEGGFRETWIFVKALADG